ncbi:MAG TPA: thiamine-phosphate kinase [Chloroflexi bacterium]|nr:thiamine-phosphate kinase [Chloroflexota bacterium]
MNVAELGEFPLIDRVRQILATEQPDVVIGIGDDVAVLDVRGDEFILATVDSQVEDVHFLRQTITPYQLGRRALAINLSDIAAMGGWPQYALASLALPTDTEVAWVEGLYRGLRVEADRFGVAVVGGNMARSAAEIFIDVTVLGHVARRHLLLRSGAQPGDRVLVTGHLGDSAAGLSLLLHPELSIPPAERALLTARHLTPTPRLPEAAVIARSGLATAMIDLSDGLNSDIGHICERSQVGVRLWAARIPVSAAASRVAAQTDKSPLSLALEGGEDYELCFTAPPEATETLIADVVRETGTPVTVVGEILSLEQGRWLVSGDGHLAPLEAGGWEHFRHRS